MSSFCIASNAHFFSKKFQHICVSLDVNFNESLTNKVVSFEQLGSECQTTKIHLDLRCLQKPSIIDSGSENVNLFRKLASGYSSLWSDHSGFLLLWL